MNFTQKIVTYLVTGALGVGKTTLIKQLLVQKPSNQYWAVLVNEFGQIGLDKALLASSQDTVAITEVAGGCLCCAGGAPFQVALKRLLANRQPDVLLIELSGLGHPLSLLRQLTAAPWVDLLVMQPMIYVVDAKQLIAQRMVIPDEVALIVANKAETFTKEQQQQITHSLSPIEVYWTAAGYLPLADLPNRPPVRRLSLFNKSPIAAHEEKELIQVVGGGIECGVQDQLEGWAIGWRFTADYVFAKDRLHDWLTACQWLRAKLVAHTQLGWLSVNTLPGESFEWRVSAWRKDSRIELIFAKSQPKSELMTNLLSCLISNSATQKK